MTKPLLTNFLFIDSIKKYKAKAKKSIVLRSIAFFFLTIFTIMTSIWIPVVINARELIVSNAEGFYAAIFWNIILSILWVSNLLKLIFISRLSKNFKRNIFKSFLAYKHLLRIKFQNPKKCVEYNELKKFIVEKMFEQQLALQGSASILHKYNFFYRKPNDLDFMSVDSSNKKINFEFHEFKLENFKITKVLDSNIYYKTNVEDVPIEVLRPKVVVNKFFEIKNKILVPNYYWMVAMKCEQLFLLLHLNAEETKIYNTIFDLAYLLNLKKKIDFVVLEEAFLCNKIDNYFVQYHLNRTQYYLENKEFKAKLNDFITNKIPELFIENQLSDLISKTQQVINFIIKNPKIINLCNKTYELTCNEKAKEALTNDYFKSSTSQNKSLINLKLEFANQNEKQNFVKKIQTRKQDYLNLLTNFECLNPVYDKYNEIDIRYLLVNKLIDRL
ncbi:hypothetical protein LQ356_01140 [Metamycoplasma faucium]|uniref:Uncharacterized protein n=1 Tax=Metamycoplasma faucium TaxID=56142 RepID=A0ABZ2TM13_9BACT